MAIFLVLINVLYNLFLWFIELVRPSVIQGFKGIFFLFLTVLNGAWVSNNELVVKIRVSIFSLLDLSLNLSFHEILL